MEAQARAAAASAVLSAEDEAIFRACTYTNPDLFTRAWLHLAATKELDDIGALPVSLDKGLAPSHHGTGHGGSRTSTSSHGMSGRSSRPNSAGTLGGAGQEGGRRRSASDVGLAPGGTAGAGFPLPASIRGTSPSAPDPMEVEEQSAAIGAGAGTGTGTGTGGGFGWARSTSSKTPLANAGNAIASGVAGISGGRRSSRGEGGMFGAPLVARPPVPAMTTTTTTTSTTTTTTAAAPGRNALPPLGSRQPARITH